jgi:hypothetical protein
MHDPANGFEEFETEEERDEAAKVAIAFYLEDGWDTDVEYITTGVITHIASQVDIKQRPEFTDEDGYDEDGEYWDHHWEFRCNYKMLPIPVSLTNKAEEIKL